ncbi:MAG: carbon-nitrogen hydrolase family protein [Thermoplasmata archaeon]|nr:MAG: carbon-nitrogen hydrolase family protein [Thermoplasmata archaeon]
MKICLANVNPKTGNKKKNLKKMEKIVTGEEADLYVFGEMSLTGYVCREEIFSLAEPEDGESLQKMQELAKEKECAIIFGMPLEQRKGIVYNAAVLVQPDTVDIYHKNFLANFGPFEERFFFTPGNSMPIFHTPHGTIGLCICYDLFFPELVKGMALKGADLVVCISASPSVTRVYFEQVLPARAIENTVFMSYANLVGEQQGLTFWGGCQSYTPKGELIAKAAYFKEDTITHDIDFSILEEARIGRPTLRDTREEMFLDVYHSAKNREVFNEHVKAGMELGRKIMDAMPVKEITVYGNEDVAFGIRLVCHCEKIEVIPSDKIWAVVKGETEEREVRLN